SKSDKEKKKRKHKKDKTPSKSISSSTSAVDEDSSRISKNPPEIHVKKAGSPLSVIA
ncbi:hypothetical protein A2U01_0087891, partial [Trifolium medium]|nr:hypothetical protein [Trifolium medium]